MSIAFNGYNNQILTFENKDAVVGSPAKISDTKTVSKCDDGNDFIGIVTSERGGAAGVQVDGYVEVKYSGDAPDLGFSGLVADSTGGVKESESAVKKYKVLFVDEENTVVGFIL